jgi:NAD(P)-dependent dehydrogenase (short-subunit alcohol dehydrogenase family)
MLNGKTALITGGTSGIGLATAKLLCANGARVAITGREADALERARKFIGGDVLPLQADVLSRNSLKKIAFDVQQAFGALDIFFANAGVPMSRRWRRPVRRNMTGSWIRMSGLYSFRFRQSNRSCARVARSS